MQSAELKNPRITSCRSQPLDRDLAHSESKRTVNFHVLILVVIPHDSNWDPGGGSEKDTTITPTRTP